MVSFGTLLNISDNTGALKVSCIKILGFSKCNHTHVGDKLVVAVKHAKLNRKVSKGDVCKGILVSQKKSIFRKTGIIFSFEKNNVVLLKKNNDPIGTRLFCGVPIELRRKKCLKLMLMALFIM